jgi:hypothetical protein
MTVKNNSHYGLVRFSASAHSSRMMESNHEKEPTTTEDEPDGIIDATKTNGTRRRWWLIVIPALLLISAAIAAVLVLVIFKDPESPQSYNEYMEDLLLALKGEDADSYLASLSSDSPHGQALQWIRTEDSGSSVLVTPPNQLLERYIMALFYFSTGGPEWKHQADFLTGKNICDWWKSQTEYLLCHNSDELTDIHFGRFL